MKAVSTRVLPLLLLLLLLLFSGRAITSETTAFEKRCHEEVVALHVMIEAWLTGRLPNTDEAFARFSDAMAQDFEIISPTGRRSDRDTIIASFRAAHGARAEDFSVAVRNVRTRLLQPELALLTYEEWQFFERGETARFSSVLFRDDPDKPGGVAWVHLQETWLPGKSPVVDRLVPAMSVKGVVAP